jgi:hypothetical protein
VIADVQRLLDLSGTSRIIAATEWREKISETQWYTIIFYHAFMMLEVEGGFLICTEKYNDKLELMFARAEGLQTCVAVQGHRGYPTYLFQACAHRNPQ